MRIIPMSASEANVLVAKWHRHNRPLTTCIQFCLGLEENGQIVGAAIVGRPISSVYEDGFTLEVRRVVTDGTKNANSTLYGAISRVAKEMGFRRLYTYTHKEESGASLRASGWQVEGESSGIGIMQVPKTYEKVQGGINGIEQSDIIEAKANKNSIVHYHTAKKWRWVKYLGDGKITQPQVTSYNDVSFLYPIANYIPTKEENPLEEAF